MTLDNHLFAAVTETWLGEHKDAEINIEGYTIFRQDRLRKKTSNRGRNSGGVAFYLRNDIAGSSNLEIQYSDGVIEVLGIFVKSKNLLHINLYRQPDDPKGGHRSGSPEFKKTLSILKETLEKFQSPTPDVILCGDFNLPHANWMLGKTSAGSSKDEQTMLTDMMDLSNEFFLTQLILKPTHRHGNTLDLLFSNNPDILHSYQCTETIFSDHMIIEGLLKYKLSQEAGEQNQLCLENGLNQLNFFSEDTDWVSLNNDLMNFDWSAEFRALSIENMMNRFLEVCVSISKDHVPLRRNRKGTSKSNIPRDRKNFMRRHFRINKQLAKSICGNKSNRLKKELVDIEKTLKKSYENDRKYSENKAVTAIKKNSKYFFNYAKKVLQD